jgi:hypothetical protein
LAENWIDKLKRRPVLADTGKIAYLCQLTDNRPEKQWDGPAMPYRPRADRDFERQLAAALTAQATSRSAMDRALSQIETAFGEAAT